MAEKRYLLTPGPTPVPPEVLAAMAQPVIHHRGPDFVSVYGRCLERLRAVCRTESDVLLFTASGTGAFESAIANLVAPGTRVVAVTAGNFGERWVKMAEVYGADVVPLRYAWGETPQPDDLRETLAQADADVVLMVHSETSTGVVADVQALTEVAKAAGATVVVDAVSSLGAVPVEKDAWGIDVLVSGSQKALMTPPGLSFVGVSSEALELAARCPTPRFVFDWERTRKAQAKLDAPFTPAVPLVLALDTALGLILDEGLEAAFDRHARLGRACRAGVKAMGLELFSPDEDRSAVVTAIRAPEDLDVGAFLLRLRDAHGIQLVGGQGDLKGKVFRVGHIGYFDVFDVTTALAGIELGLVESGIEIERGVAVSAALEAYSQAARV
jgi:aspartate aminotransferase-like enzyme